MENKSFSHLVSVFQERTAPDVLSIISHKHTFFWQSVFGQLISYLNAIDLPAISRKHKADHCISCGGKSN